MGERVLAPPPWGILLDVHWLPAQGTFGVFQLKASEFEHVRPTAVPSLKCLPVRPCLQLCPR